MRKIFLIFIILGVVVIFGPTRQVDAGFIYTRTPVGDTVPSPLSLRVQGVFGIDFCVDVRAASYGYWVRDARNPGTPGRPVTSNFRHTQGEVVDETVPVDLPPGTYFALQLVCADRFDSVLGGIINVEGTINIVPIAIITNDLSDGLVDEPYSQILQSSRGTMPRTWSIIGGSLPSGLFLNSLTGEISGIPTAVEAVSFTAQVIDANNNVATKDLFIIVHGNTPAGSNVLVGPFNDITLIFSQVIQEGHTTVASSSSGPTPPSGFKLGNPPTYYSISTTAQFNPPVEVCITYDDTQFKNEKNLKLFHFENGQWVNVTTLLDIVNNEICGSISSFSEFGLFEDISVDHIIDEIQGFNLDPDIEQGLLDKLNAIKSAIERNQNKTAKNILKAFINLVNAQENKKITPDQANILRTDAQALINSLGGNLLSTIFKWVLFGWLDRFINAMVGSKL